MSAGTVSVLGGRRCLFELIPSGDGRVSAAPACVRGREPEAVRSAARTVLLRLFRRAFRSSWRARLAYRAGAIKGSVGEQAQEGFARPPCPTAFPTSPLLHLSVPSALDRDHLGATGAPSSLSSLPATPLHRPPTRSTCTCTSANLARHIGRLIVFKPPTGLAEVPDGPTQRLRAAAMALGDDDADDSSRWLPARPPQRLAVDPGLWVPLGDKRQGMIAVAVAATVSLVFLASLLAYIATLLWRYRARSRAGRVEKETRALRFLASSHGVAFISLLAGGAHVPFSSRVTELTPVTLLDRLVPGPRLQPDLSRATRRPRSRRPKAALWHCPLTLEETAPTVAHQRRRPGAGTSDPRLHRTGRPHPGRRHRQRLLVNHHLRQPLRHHRPQAPTFSPRPPQRHRTRVALLWRLCRCRARQVPPSARPPPLLRQRRRVVLDHGSVPVRAPHAALPLGLCHGRRHLPPLHGHRDAHLVAAATARARRLTQHWDGFRRQGHARLPGHVRRDYLAPVGV